MKIAILLGILSSDEEDGMISFSNEAHCFSWMRAIWCARRRRRRTSAKVYASRTIASEIPFPACPTTPGRAQSSRFLRGWPSRLAKPIGPNLLRPGPNYEPRSPHQGSTGGAMYTPPRAHRRLDASLWNSSSTTQKLVWVGVALSMRSLERERERETNFRKLI